MELPPFNISLVPYCGDNCTKNVCHHTSCGLTIFKEKRTTDAESGNLWGENITVLFEEQQH